MHSHRRQEADRRIGLRPRWAVAALLLAAVIAGCASSSSGARPPRQSSLVAAKAAAPRSIDRLTRQVRLRYDKEAHGAPVHADLHTVATDPGFLAALRTGRRSALRAYVTRRFNQVWFVKRHMSRLLVLQRRQVVVDLGVPFVVRPSVLVIPASGHHPATELEISVQDVIGFVRYVRRNLGAFVLVRGAGAAHVRTSLPAARGARLPARGAVTLAGRRYEVRSFAELGFNHEPLTIWVLQRV